MMAPLRLDFWRTVRPLLLMPALALGYGAHGAPFAAATAHAVRADITITGQVLDEKGTGLPGVNVIVKGTTTGTQTDASGRYSIQAPDNATLIFTFVGYTTREEVVGGRTSINAALKPDANGLEEVVVVGYGVQEKKMLATSIATISTKQVELIPVASPSEALVGLVAGAQITEPSGEPGQGAVIRIRGLGSISAGNNPLYVVDGYPLNSPDNYNQIPPGDIQSIQILKDAAACAIYGSRGGNGIVIVTTKHGASGGKTKFNFSANSGIQNVAKKVGVLNRDQYLSYAKDAYSNAGQTLPLGLANDPSTYADTDWQNEIFQTGVQQNYQLSASGGSEKNRFYVSGGYFNQSGITKGTGFERFSLRANYDAQLSPKLKLGLNLAPSFTRTDVRPVSGSYNGGNISGGNAPGGETAAVTTALILSPLVPAHLPNGDYGLLSNSVLNPNGTSGISIADLLNPVAPLELYQDRTSSVRALSSAFLDFEVVKGLHLRTNLGTELINNRRGIYVPATLPTNNSRTANLSKPVLNNIDARQLNNTNLDRKSTRLNSSHSVTSRMPSSA